MSVAVQPEHGVLRRPGHRKPLRNVELPPWHAWRFTSEASRAIRWIESELIVPTGFGAGRPMKLRGFQRSIIRAVYDNFATFASVPTGNTKTSLFAAIALERICRGDSYAKVDVASTKEDQAAKLLNIVEQFIELNPTLADTCLIHVRDGVIEYRHTGSRIEIHPGKTSALQGLNFNLGLVDEVGFVPAEQVMALMARLPKRPDARFAGFGTPGFDEGDSVLKRYREESANGLPPGMAYLEWSAPEGCDVTDVKALEQANPALRAGLLDRDRLLMLARTMDETDFRRYHLGQWIGGAGPWLPAGVWNVLPRQEPPDVETPVVLGVWGNYKRSAAIVGATLDGGVFFGWAAEHASDDEIAQAVRAAADRWKLEEVVHKPWHRGKLMNALADEGLPVRMWDTNRQTDVESAGAFYQAIIGGELGHDGDEFMAEQVSRLSGKVDRNGNLRLVESTDNDVSAALAARAAWWRARKLAESLDEEEPVVW